MRQRGRRDIARGFLASALVLALISVSAMAGAPSFPSSTHEDIWNLLTAEIARDRHLTASGVNKARMNMIKEALAPAVAVKEGMVNDLAGTPDPLLGRIGEMLAATLADEKRIVEGGGTHRYQRFAEQALRGNLMKKEAALKELEEAIR